MTTIGFVERRHLPGAQSINFKKAVLFLCELMDYNPCGPVGLTEIINVSQTCI